jgi:hypothetical protein
MSLVVKADGETPKATATSTATGTAQTSGGSFSTGIALNSISNKSLAPGAIAGIVIGVIIAFAAFLLALFFFRRKQRNAKHNSLNSDVPRSPPQPSNDGEKTGWTFTDKDIQHAPSAVYEVPLTLAPDTPRTLVNLGYDSSRNTSMESLSRPPKSPRHQLIQSFPLPSDTTPPPTPSVHRFPAEPVPIQPLPIQSIQPAPVVTFTRTNSKRGVDNPFPARKPAPSNEPLPDNRLKDPRNSEESLTKITPTKVSVVQVQGMQRKPSIKTLPSKAPEKRGILVTKSSKDDLTSHDERI